MLRRSISRAAAAGPTFTYTPIFAHSDHAEVPMRKLTSDFVEVKKIGGGLPDILTVHTDGLTLLAKTAFSDIAHLLRPGHLQQLRKILDDPDASDNDRYVALQLLKNANIAAGRILPGCQDTGTAIVAGYKGEQCWTVGDESDEAALSRGVFKTYTETSLRYSQMAPLTMYDEKNTGSNLPAQIEISAKKGSKYEFLFIAKGGGSANKTFLYQETKAVLNPKSMRQFLEEKIGYIGTSACPPYHLTIVVGGTSA